MLLLACFLLTILLLLLVPLRTLLLSTGVGGMNQMQMLMYYAQLGMMAQMNNAGGGMGMPGVPAAGGLPNMPGMANPMMFSMMNPQQMAAFCASAQQQWQAGMPATAIANIAAAAAVAATAATNQDVSGALLHRLACWHACSAAKPVSTCLPDFSIRSAIGPAVPSADTLNGFPAYTLSLSIFIPFTTTTFTT